MGSRTRDAVMDCLRLSLLKRFGRNQFIRIYDGKMEETKGQPPDPLEAGMRIRMLPGPEDSVRAYPEGAIDVEIRCDGKWSDMTDQEVDTMIDQLVDKAVEDRDQLIEQNLKSSS